MLTVQLPTYAEKVHFAAALCAAAPCCYGAGSHAAIAQYLPPARPTAANSPHVAAAGDYDRRMGGQMNGQHYFIDPAPQTMLAVPCQ